ncbi:hypothetical protein [Burkholderia sp. JP2-270]|nr:hypothetical protein [Burkholderia sp. JP2-270]
MESDDIWGHNTSFNNNLTVARVDDRLFGIPVSALPSYFRRNCPY